MDVSLSSRATRRWYQGSSPPSRSRYIVPQTFNRPQLLKEWSVGALKGRNRKLLPSSIDCDPFRPFSRNRLRAVGVEISGKRPPVGPGRRQGSAGRPAERPGTIQFLPPPVASTIPPLPSLPVYRRCFSLPTGRPRGKFERVRLVWLSRVPRSDKISVIIIYDALLT